MSKEIQVLRLIFELELSPPFKIVDDPDMPTMPDIYNKYSERVGVYVLKTGLVDINQHVCYSFLRKIKRTFNVNEISDEEVYNIAKHLYDWLRDLKVSNIKEVDVWNPDTARTISYNGTNINNG